MPSHRHGVCRQALLSAAITLVLGAWSMSTLAASANATAAVDAAGGAIAGPVATGADSTSNVADAGTTSDGEADMAFSFDRSMLSGAGSNTTDLSRFEHGNPVLPGSYNVDIYLNNNWAGRRDVRFASAAPDASAAPCVDRQLLALLGLHPANLSSELVKALADPVTCVSIGDLIPGASMSFDMGNLRLDTSVPQAYLQQRARLCQPGILG